MKVIFGFFLLLNFSFFLGSCKGNANKEHVELSLEDALLKYPDSVDLLIQKGKKDFELLQFKSSLSYSAKAYRLDTNNIDAKLLYAQVLNDQPDRTVEDVRISQAHFVSILGKRPNDLKALVYLASTYSYFQDFEKSFHYINKALKVDPKYRDAYVLKGSNYRLLGDMDLAKSSYETAVQQDPDFLEAYIMLGTIYESEQNPICLEYYTTAVELKPKDPDVLYTLAFAKEQFNKVDEAELIYRKMVAIDNDYYEALFHLGYIKQFTAKDIDSAIYFYQNALAAQPKFIQAWHNLGLCFEDKKDIMSASNAFKKALAIDPSYELSRSALEKYQ
jgi:tetratricopeptide (TPR) repeat protein